jgi:carboxyl-terminal processing protease
MLEVFKRCAILILLVGLAACGNPPDPTKPDPTKPDPTLPLEQQAANPAWDNFQKSFGSIESGYYGYSSLDFPALRTQYTQQLVTACARQSTCSLEVSNAVLDDLIAKINDGHTFRRSPMQTQIFTAKTQGQNLPCTGLEFVPLPNPGPNSSNLIVTRAISSEAGFLAGLRRGDVVFALNGKTLETFATQAAALTAIQSEEVNNRKFTLEVGTANATRRTVTLEPKPCLSWLPSLEVRPDGIAVITLYQFWFNSDIADRVHGLVRQAQQSNARGIVLDLRHSSGGSLNEAIAAAGAFLETVPSVRMEYRSGSSTHYDYAAGMVLSKTFGSSEEPYRVRVVRSPQRWTGAMIVLVNSSTRSAAEYLAFLIQLQAQAVILGQPSVGVLNSSSFVSTLEDGSLFAVTAARSQELSGKAFPERVTPDVIGPDDLSKLALGQDVLLELAVNRLLKP